MRIMFKKCFYVSLVTKYFPVTVWSKKYRFSFLKNDLIAGLTVGLTLIPQALAYGSLAGLPPQYGLFSAFWGPFLYFLLGTSRDLTLGPTAILSLLVAHYARQAPLKEYAVVYAVALALLCGCIQLTLGLFKLGFIANFMSPTVVSAFTTSGAIIIAWGQVKTLLGLRTTHTEFFQSVYDIFSNISYANISDLSLGMGCLIFLITFKIAGQASKKISNIELSGFEKIFHKLFWFVCICSNIIVIILSSLLAYTMDMYDVGDLTITGNIKAGLPVFQVPRFKIRNSTHILKTETEFFQEIGSGIPVLTLIALVEAMAIGKAFARQNGYRIRSSQEFIAIGFSNIIGSFFQAFPITGSFSRTAINSQCSSKSPLSGVITGLLVVLALLVLTPYFHYIPKTALAAIIIVAVLFMTDFRYVLRTWYINKYDIFTWLVTFIMSLGLGVEYGVLSGIAVSILPILFTASRPDFKSQETFAKFEGSKLWFPFTSKLMSMIECIDKGKYSVLSLEGVCSIDSAILNTLLEAGQEFQMQGKYFIVICNHSEVKELISRYSGDKTGLFCFSSINEAQSKSPGLLREDWLGENVSIITTHDQNS